VACQGVRLGPGLTSDWTARTSELASPRGDGQSPDIGERPHGPVNMSSRSFLARFLVGRMLTVAPTILLELETISASGFFLDAVIAFPALATFEPDIFPHDRAPALCRGAGEGVKG
jgi:hypothetical protein